MWGVCLLLLLWTSSSQQSELFDLLSMADRFFDEFQWSDDRNLHVEEIESVVKRTYELGNERQVFKRSLTDEDEDDDGNWIRDRKGVYLLRNIEDVAKIPARFPNDINTLTANNLLFLTALEANGTNPEIQLANDMVLYQYSPMSGIEEMGRVPVFGGIKTAIHSFQNAIYFITAEHEAKSNPDSFEGSTLYKLIERQGRFILEKVQILNVIEPNDVKFWEHQDEFYLAIGSNMGNDTLRTSTLIYRWMGRHFNCIQHIPSKFVKSVVPFSMGSFMYLAIANYQDEYGNTDIYSEIYQFHLDDFKFHLFQSIKTHGAHHVAHVKFESEESKKSEHFLAVANHMGKNANGALTSYLESVIYKFNGNLFVPFQSFKLLGATKWLPIQGTQGEFLLLVSHSHGLRGYQYDGWRFSTVSLKFGQSTLGGNIQSIRAFQYFGEIFLTIADKNSYGENINLWKLSFANRNDLEEKHNELEAWCEGMNRKMANDNFTEILTELKSIAEETPELREIRGENLLKEKEPQEDVLRELEVLGKEIEDVNRMLNDFEETTGNHGGEEEEISIVMDSESLPRLEIKCDTRNCLNFKNLEILNVNGEDFPKFLSDVVSTDGDFSDSDLSFERVLVEGDLTSSFVNGHSSATLVDVSSETFINSELLVNGTVFINNDLNVFGLFDGVVPDKNHLFLYEGDQNLDDKLKVDVLTVDNLKLTGILNDHPIEELLLRPKMEFQNSYEELKVNDLVVEGLVDGCNISQLFEDGVRNSGNQEIQGDLNVVTLEADEVIVDSDEISNMTASELLISNPCLTGIPSEEVGNPFGRRQKSLDGIPEEHIIVVEGLLKANDISDDATTTLSLSDIVTDSYQLNESIIDSHLEFSNVVVDGDFQADEINGIPIDSWILKNSTRVQRIGGRKSFSDGIHVREKVFVDEINGIDLTDSGGNDLKSNGDQEITGDWTFDTINCNELVANFTNFENLSFVKLNRLFVKESIEANVLQADNLTVAGRIDGISWSHFLRDSVFDPNDLVEGEKTIVGTLRVENLNLTGRINGLLLDELIDLGSKGGQTIILDRDVDLEGTLRTEELNFEGRFEKNAFTGSSAIVSS